ncbi:BID domain-containing T4SS effector [Bartonella sp. AR 15-3]|uniref:BID domain-containing T4SS effector n=1 Tax=Bartonella sp. AR 15-3 TaxID=545617 RepID=UPI0001F4CEF8|nr:BID domain-containing T4SS effector [Bartonella sp. AR 15-3]OPB31781.1 Bartonella effector protein Bep3 [Bartonella sp. AR 15-3]CBI79185.1 Bartonella effector protein (Bep); substrate of VirB T4SS [Bartonella sp. AR 15-3]
MKSYSSTSLSVEELQKRRQIVEAAVHTHTIENIALHSDTITILEQYAKGNYSLNEFNAIMDNFEKTILGDVKKVRVEDAELPFHSDRPSSYNYVYPFTFVLKNKYGVADMEILSTVGGHSTVKALVNLYHEPLPEKFDSTYLKYLHRRLFENTFEWAGHSRDLPFVFDDGTIAIMPTMRKISKESDFRNKKGDGFVESAKIVGCFDYMDKTLAEQNNLQGLSRKDFVNKAAHMFAFLNYVHPFRDGNGRTQRIFFEKLAEAAGHKLDFSVVTRKRMVVCSKLSMGCADTSDDISVMRHMFEDISNPKTVSIMKEFISSMNNIEYQEAQKKIIVMPNKGDSYVGVYENDSPESILVKVDRDYILEPIYMIFKKDYLSPTQIKALKSGDTLNFVFPTNEDIKSVLIPEEILAPLTSDQISQRVMVHPTILSKERDVNIYARRVYKQVKEFNEKMALINKNENFDKVLIKQITDSPESISKLAGKKILGFKNSKYKTAQRNIEALTQQISGYGATVRDVRHEIVQEHLVQQKRLMTVVKMPSKELQDIFNLSEDMQKEALNFSPSLQKELDTFIREVRSRLTPSEHKWLCDAKYTLLAESIGISESKAKTIQKLFVQGKQLQSLLKSVKLNDVGAINMAS